MGGEGLVTVTFKLLQIFRFTGKNLMYAITAQIHFDPLQKIRGSLTPETLLTIAHSPFTVTPSA